MDDLGKSLDGVKKTLEQSVKTGDFNSLEALIKAQAQAFKNTDGLSLVNLAIVEKKLSIVKLLVSHDITFDRHQALECAVAHGYEPVVAFLLDDEQSFLEKSLPRNVSFKLQNDAGNNPGDILLALPTKEPCINKPFATRHGKTLLHLAIESNQLSIIILLLKRGSRADLKDHDGRNALHISAQLLNVQATKCLLGQQFKLISKDRFEQTALDLAMAKSFSRSKTHGVERVDVSDREKAKEIVKLIFEKASEEERAYFLYRAILNSNIDLVEQLCAISNKIQLNKPLTKRYGWRFLHYAVETKSFEMVELLMKKGADFTIPNDANITPLGRAMQIEATEIIRLFLEQKELTDQTLHDHFFQALEKGYTSSVELLLKTSESPPSPTRKKHLSVNLQLDKSCYEWRPLHIAAFNGHLDLIKLLIEKGAQINAIDTRSRTPLHLAIETSSNALDIAEALLAQDVSNKSELKLLNQKDTIGRTPLKLATQYQNISIIELLLNYYKQDKSHQISQEELNDTLRWAAANQSKDTLKIIQFLLNEFHFDPSALTSTLHIILLQNYMNEQASAALVELLLSKGASINAKDPKTKRTPLMIAIQQNKEALVELFLKDPSIDVKSLDRESLHALNLAARSPAMLQRLLTYHLESGVGFPSLMQHPLISAVHADNKASVEILLQNLDDEALDPESLGYTFIWAAEKGYLSIVKTIIVDCRFDVDKTLTTQAGKTFALAAAASKGQTAVVEFLLDNNATSTLVNPKGFTALLVAIQNGHQETACFIIDRAGPDIHLQNEEDISPLHLAAQDGQLIVVQRLLKNKVNTDCITRRRWTALHLAILNQHESIALLLANVGGSELNTPGGSDQDKPLNLAAENNLTSVVEVLLSKRVEIDSKNRRGETPLHLAILNRYDELSLRLINAGASIDAVIDGKIIDTSGEVIEPENYTTLHLAVQSGSLKLVQRLLELGISPNVSTSNGITPLHSLPHTDTGDKKWSTLPILKLLLFYGANIDSLALRETPLHLSSRHGDLEMTRHLVETYYELKQKNQNIKDIINLPNESSHEQGSYTPIHFAIYHRHPMVVQYLIDHADFSHHKQGWIALKLAVSGKNNSKKRVAADFPETPLSPRRYPPFFQMDNTTSVEDTTEVVILKTVVNKYLKHCTLSNTEKADLLNAAIQARQTNILQFLLTQSGFSPNYQGSDKQYPIQVAVGIGSIEMTEILYANKADINLKGTDTPLSCALYAGNLELAQWFLSHHADPSIQGEGERNSVHWSVIGSHTESVRLVLNNQSSSDAKKLINSQDKLGLTALHLATLYNPDSEITDILLSYGADCNQTVSLQSSETTEGNQLWTPMSLALYSGNDALVDALFRERARVDTDTMDDNQWGTFTKILIDSTKILENKKNVEHDVYATVIESIATHYVNCMIKTMDALKQISSAPDVRLSMKVMSDINRGMTNYLQGKPIDNFGSKPPESALKTIKTPGSSAANLASYPFGSLMRDTRSPLTSPPSTNREAGPISAVRLYGHGRGL